jgi:hypothetical protein
MPGGQGGALLAQYLMSLSDRENRINMAGKSADFARKAMGDQAPMLTGVTDEEWQNLGSRDKAAAMQGWQQQQTLAQMMAKTKMEQGQTDANDFYSKIGGSLSDQINSAPMDPLTEQPMTEDPNTAALVSRLSPEQQAVIRAIGKAGPGNRGAGAVMAPLVKSILGQGVNPTPSLEFQEDPVSGARFAAYGHTLQPSGVNPAKARPTTEMVDDGSGGQVPVLVNPKTGAGTALRTGGVTPQDQFKSASAMNLAKMQKALTMIATPGLDTNTLSQAQQMLKEAQSEQEDLVNSHPGSGAAKTKALTPDLAAKYLQNAKGDKAKARAAAKADGYTF